MSCIATYNFKCVIQNQTASKVLTWKVKDTGEPIDLTIYPEMKLGLFSRSGKIGELSLGNGLVISGDNSEILTATFDQDITSSMAGIVTYELMFVRSSGENWYPLGGNIMVIKTNTR